MLDQIMMQFLKLSFSLLGLFLALSCSSYHPHALSSSQIADQLQSRNLQDPGLRLFLETNLHQKFKAGPIQNWDFPLLTLAAFYYHPDLDVARAQWHINKAAVVTAGERPNPTLSFTPEFITNPGAGISPWILTHVLDFPIETAGKRHYRVKQAEQTALAAKLNLVTTTWQIRSRLQNALVGLHLAQNRQEILQTEQTALSDYTGLLNQRVASGMVSPLGAIDFQILNNQTRLDLQNSQSQIHQALADVAAALTIPERALQSVHLSLESLKSLPSEKSVSLVQLQSQALNNRADILAGIIQYDACQSALQLELAKRYPDFNLGPGYQWSQGEHHWTLGLSVALPIFNQNKGAIGEAKARCEEAAAKFLALQSQVMSNLEHAWIGYQDALKSLRVADSLAAAQSKRFETFKNSLNSSEAVRSSLVNLQVTYDVAVLARLDAFSQAQKALAVLEDVLQMPLQRGKQSYQVSEALLESPRN